MAGRIPVNIVAGVVSIVAYVVAGTVLIATMSASIGVKSASAAPPETRVAGDFPVASEVRLGGDDAQTRMVVDFTQKIEMRAFTLANPYRVVIDMPQVTFQLPAKTGETGRGLIKAFRYGLVMPGGSRMVIDLTKPVRIDKAFVLAPENDQPARLVLDLVATDRDAFLRTIALDNRAAGAPSRPAVHEVEKSSDPRPMVILDPGHGGIDNGTRAGSGETEKAIVLEFANLLRDKLEKTGKFRIAMTRADDSFVALADRVHFARAHQAALFISIHADALARGEGDAQGATVYTLSEKASDAAAARLAEEENRADVIAGLDLSSEPNDIVDILIDLAKRETKTFSVQFARGLLSEMRNVTRLHKDPLKSAGFRVLRAPDVPSVLVELGYVSNRSDLKSLLSDAWRDRTADTIVQAVGAYFRTRIAGSGRN
jgi:N-acetylmuramoyl-L-alanine amidase